MTVEMNNFLVLSDYKMSPQEARISLALASKSIKLKAVRAVSKTDYYIFVCLRAL